MIDKSNDKHFAVDPATGKAYPNYLSKINTAAAHTEDGKDGQVKPLLDFGSETVNVIHSKNKKQK